MKTYSIALLTAAVALMAGCSTAYRSGQTPDAVYAPAGTAVSPSGGTEAVSRENPDAGNYITYQNDQYSNGDYYNNDSYATDSYGSPYSLYSFNNIYLGMPGYLGLGYGPLGWNPYMWSYPSLSLAFTFGSPWGRWYRPYAFSPYAYNPYFPAYYGYYGGYHSYLPGYYDGYGYGYGYGYGGSKYLNLRPANSYAPRNSHTSRARSAVSPGTRTSGTNVAPRRVFRSGTSGNTTERPRRIFRSKPDEHPIGVNPGRTVERQQPSRTVNRQSRQSTNTYRRVETRPQTEQRTYQQPQRTYQQNDNRVERSAPSYQSTPRSSAPRTYSPRGRR